MTTKSVIKQCFNILREDGDWINGAYFERLNLKNKNGTTAKPSSVGRALRNLKYDYEGRIEEREYGPSGSIEYRYIPSKYEQLHSTYTQPK